MQGARISGFFFHASRCEAGLPGSGDYQGRQTVQVNGIPPIPGLAALRIQISL
jgi:hypothetical protein